MPSSRWRGIGGQPVEIVVAEARRASARVGHDPGAVRGVVGVRDRALVRVVGRAPLDAWKANVPNRTPAWSPAARPGDHSILAGNRGGYRGLGPVGRARGRVGRHSLWICDRNAPCRERIEEQRDVPVRGSVMTSMNEPEVTYMARPRRHRHPGVPRRPGMRSRRGRGGTGSHTGFPRPNDTETSSSAVASNARIASSCPTWSPRPSWAIRSVARAVTALRGVYAAGGTKTSLSNTAVPIRRRDRHRPVHPGWTVTVNGVGWPSRRSPECC